MKLTHAVVPYPGWGPFVAFCAVPVLCAVLFLLLLRWRRGRSSLAKIVLLNFLALLGFAATAFVAGECYYRFVYDTTDSFNYTYASKRWFERYYRYNNAELRDNVDYPGDIPAGKRRVTILGDSFTAGQGVKDVEDRFANRLRKAHPEWDVQVLAVEGLDTGDEIMATQRMLDHDYKLDTVVLVYCLNDLTDMMPEWKEAMNRIFSDWFTRNWIVNNSYFANTFYYRLKAKRDPNIPNYFGIVKDAYKGPLWEVQKQRLTKLRDMITQRGGKFMVVTFPFLHIVGPNYEYQFVHDQLGQHWKELGVPHLDLLPMYQKYAPAELVVNRLDAHPSVYAHQLAAQAMDGFIAEQMKPAAAGKK